MQLLLDRDQTGLSWFSLVPLRIGAGVTFTLHATLELDAEEEALLQQYNLTKVPLVVSDTMEDLKKAFRPALFVGFIIFIIGWLGSGIPVGLLFGTLVTMTMTATYFSELREQIIVSELMADGRKFRCDSVVALIQKEAYLEYICSYLRQVLESAKNWHDREALPIPPLRKEAAKLAVLKALT